MMKPLATTLWTAWAATALFAIFLAVRLLTKPEYRTAITGRCWWTAACVVNAVHMAIALMWFFEGNHAAAWEHTARQTASVVGLAWGGGLIVNYVFAALWIADVVWWWSNPTTYAARGRRIDAIVYGFAAFMYCNATIVFAHGPIRWLATAYVVLLAVAYWIKFRRPIG